MELEIIGCRILWRRSADCISLFQVEVGVSPPLSPNPDPLVLLVISYHCRAQKCKNPSHIRRVSDQVSHNQKCLPQSSDTSPLLFPRPRRPTQHSWEIRRPPRPSSRFIRSLVKNGSLLSYCLPETQAISRYVHSQPCVLSVLGQNQKEQMSRKHFLEMFEQSLMGLSLSICLW